MTYDAFVIGFKVLVACEKSLYLQILILQLPYNKDCNDLYDHLKLLAEVIIF